MEMAYAAQQEVIATLHEIGDHDLAARLERCMTARLQRHYGSGWPYSCRSPACYWCRRAMIRGWWAGITLMVIGTTAASSLAIISIPSPAGLPDAVRRLRRGLRDVRDRAARRWKRWRTVCLRRIDGRRSHGSGVISHDGVDRREVLDVLRRRWPMLW